MILEPIAFFISMATGLLNKSPKWWNLWMVPNSSWGCYPLISGKSYKATHILSGAQKLNIFDLIYNLHVNYPIW